MKVCSKIYMSIVIILAIICSTGKLHAQTEFDAIMMNKNQFCSGFMYNYSSWEEYWEGTMKRNNENIGTVTSQSVMYMANYGITDNLNVMAGLPYVWNKASAGTLHEMKGVQDVSVFVKWIPYSFSFGKNKFTLFTIGGFSTPVSDYVIDFLPLSIGMGSTNIIGRGMVDYQYKKFTATASASYIHRSNVKIDRNSYYDTELHLTNEVDMPDVAFYQLRTGFRFKYLIAEALLSKHSTLGGFDISRNNMPFPSNNMDATMIGLHLKHSLKNIPGLEIYAGANHTVSCRNVGQSTGFNVGVFYVFYFKSKQSDKK